MKRKINNNFFKKNFLCVLYFLILAGSKNIEILLRKLVL